MSDPLAPIVTDIVTNLEALAVSVVVTFDVPDNTPFAVRLAVEVTVEPEAPDRTADATRLALCEDNMLIVPEIDAGPDRFAEATETVAALIPDTEPTADTTPLAWIVSVVVVEIDPVPIRLPLACAVVPVAVDSAPRPDALALVDVVTDVVPDMSGWIGRTTMVMALH